MTSKEPNKGENHIQKRLVSVSERKVLCPDILVGIFGPLLQWWHVAPVLPMRVPQPVSVEAGGNQTRNRDASSVC